MSDIINLETNDTEDNIPETNTIDSVISESSTNIQSDEIDDLRMNTETSADVVDSAIGYAETVEIESTDSDICESEIVTEDNTPGSLSPVANAL